MSYWPTPWTNTDGGIVRKDIDHGCAASGPSCLHRWYRPWGIWDPSPRCELLPRCWRPGPETSPSYQSKYWSSSLGRSGCPRTAWTSPTSSPRRPHEWNQSLLEQTTIKRWKLGHSWISGSDNDLQTSDLPVATASEKLPNTLFEWHGPTDQFITLMKSSQGWLCITFGTEIHFILMKKSN